jgi:hypothetical protein
MTTRVITEPSAIIPYSELTDFTNFLNSGGANASKENEGEDAYGKDQPTAFDQVNGGIREWLNRRAVQSKNVNVEGTVAEQRLAVTMRKQALHDKITQGTIDSYAGMNRYQDKLRNRGYRPQARLNPKPQFYDTFESPYEGDKGTAGLMTNMPDVATWIRDDNLNPNRGRLQDDMRDGKFVDEEEIMVGRGDFVENPNIHAYKPWTYGINAEQPSDAAGVGRGVIFGPKQASPIGGPTYDVKLAEIPDEHPVYGKDFINSLPRGHRPGPSRLYHTQAAYGSQFPSTLTNGQSMEIRRANGRGERPHATRMRRSVETKETYFDFY